MKCPSQKSGRKICSNVTAIICSNNLFSLYVLVHSDLGSLNGCGNNFQIRNKNKIRIRKSKRSPLAE